MSWARIAENGLTLIVLAGVGYIIYKGFTKKYTPQQLSDKFKIFKR